MMVSLLCAREEAPTSPGDDSKTGSGSSSKRFFLILSVCVRVCVCLVSYSNYGPITDSQNQAGESRRGLYFPQPRC